MRFASAFACVLCLFSLTAAPAIAQDAGAPRRPTGAAGGFRAASRRRHPEEGRPRPRPRRRRARRRRSRSPPPRRSRLRSSRCSRPSRCPALVASTAAPSTCRRCRAARSRSPSIRPPSAALRQADIAKFKDASVPEVLQNTVPGVILSDAQGNAYQRSLQYRGFDASPVNGACAGPRRLPERRAHQRKLRRHRQLGLPARQRHRRHHHPRRQSGLRPQCARRRRRHHHARRLQFPGRRDRQPLRLLRSRSGLGVAAGARSGNWGAFVAGEYIQDDGFRDFSRAEIKRAATATSA